MDKQVSEYINKIADKSRRDDIEKLAITIKEISGQDPKMWGTSIISFGTYHYKYESGMEGDAPKVGLSNRKQAIVIYGLVISDPSHPNFELVKSLGKVKQGKGCMYINKLSDIDLNILERMVSKAY